ncbi:hypothetical protein ACVWWN_005005 [Mycobacterium sp. URHB0021]
MPISNPDAKAVNATASLADMSRFKFLYEGDAVITVDRYGNTASTTQCRGLSPK